MMIESRTDQGIQSIDCEQGREIDEQRQKEHQHLNKSFWRARILVLERSGGERPHHAPASRGDGIWIVIVIVPSPLQEIKYSVSCTAMIRCNEKKDSQFVPLDNLTVNTLNDKS